MTAQQRGRHSQAATAFPLAIVPKDIQAVGHRNVVRRDAAPVAKRQRSEGN